MSENVMEQMNKMFETQIQLINEKFNTYDEEIDNAFYAREQVESAKITQLKNNFDIKVKELEDNFNVLAEQRLKKSKNKLIEKKNLILNLENSFNNELNIYFNNQLSDLQNKFMNKISNVRDVLDKDDDFLNGYGNFSEPKSEHLNESIEQDEFIDKELKDIVEPNTVKQDVNDFINDIIDE